MTETPEITSTAGAGWWPLTAIVLAVFMLMLDATVTTVALPSLQRDLHADLSDLQWVMNAYTLAMAAFQLTAGSLADRLGRRRCFTAGVLLFAAASLACALATTAGALIAARTVQGLAAAMMFATTLALIAQCYQGSARGLAFGVRGTAAGIAVVLGPMVGGALVSGLNWRWIFLINLPIAAFTLLIARTKLPHDEPLRPRPKVDRTSPILLAIALTLLTLALLRGNDDGWGSAQVLAMIAGSASTLIAFLLAQHRRSNPLLDLALFRDRTFTGTQIGSLTVQASVFALLIYLSLYFQDDLGYSALHTGLCFLPFVVPILVAGPLAGAVMDRLPKRHLSAGALALVASGLTLMHGLAPTSTWTHLVPGMIIAGLGCGIALPVLGNLAVDIPDQHQLGMASGVNNTVLQIGFTVGVAAYGAVLGRQPGSPTALIDGLNQMFTIAALVSLIGAALTLTLIQNRAASASHDDRR